MIQIGLLRHGEVEGGNCFRGHTDDPLTAIGLNQMHAATRDNQRWDRVISSPLARCAAFAGEYAGRHSIPQTFDARLMEMNFGAWEGRCAADLMETDTDALTLFWENPMENTPPGGEPLALFQARVLDAWHDIVMAHEGRRILVVTHGGVIRALLCHVLDQPLAQLQSFEVNHGGLYRVQAGDAGKILSTCDAIRRI
ncbi:MAG: alpha-ribazole phosphatase family protein [Gammaproteobacteria bacterium]|nr:alpha-ribazole phosphatase family protein [Gammaproteobacteria bacterium]